MTVDLPMTYEVMFTDTLVLGDAGPGIGAIEEPTAGAVEYVTELSDQDPLADLTLPATGEPSLVTYSLSTAELMVEPAGIEERLKRRSARRVGELASIHTSVLEPKFVPGLLLSTYVSAVGIRLVTVDDAACANCGMLPKNTRIKTAVVRILRFIVFAPPRMRCYDEDILEPPSPLSLPLLSDPTGMWGAQGRRAFVQSIHFTVL